MGSVVLTHLSAPDLSVVDVDRPESPAGAGYGRQPHLLDQQAVTDFFADSRAGAVVHLANHSNVMCAHPAVVYAENTAMTWHVLETASAAGCTRMIMSGGPNSAYAYANASPTFPIPADGAETLNPGNAYGLSNVAGEEALALWRRTQPVSGVALPLPTIASDESKFPASLERYDWTHPPQGFCAFLPASAAASLIHAIVQASLSGFLIYPSSYSVPAPAPDLSTLLRGPYRGASLRRPAEQISGPYDNTRLTVDAGWSAPSPAPAPKA